MKPVKRPCSPDVDAELDAFVAGETDLATFTHTEHVRLAFEMLQREDFETALGKFALGLRRLAKRAGAPKKYHTTVTVAFLALVGERRMRGGARDWTSFAAANPDLLDKLVLEQWYPAERLRDDVARRTFVLPVAAAS